MDHLAGRWVDKEEDRKDQETSCDERERETLETSEVTGACCEHNERGGCQDAPELWQSEIVECQRDADEFGDDG
jgi:hypothetical protein